MGSSGVARSMKFIPSPARAVALALAAALAACASDPIEDSPASAQTQHGTHLANTLGLTRTPILQPPHARAAAPAPATFESPFGDRIAQLPRSGVERSVEGNELLYWIVGDGPETVFVLGGIHGDEQSSAELAYEFLAWVVDHPATLGARRLVVAPEVNPDGLRANTRRNQHDVDLNRNFPADNWSGPVASNPAPGPRPSSEPETRFVLALIREFAPTRIVSAHAAAACVNWDGPAESLARHMARECGLPTKASIGYPTPGSLGSFMGFDRSTPTVTLELASKSGLGVARDGYLRALMTAVHYPLPPPPSAVAFDAPPARDAAATGEPAYVAK